MKRLNQLIIVLVLTMNSGCAGQDFDFEGMERSEKAFNERARQQTLTLMSLETMFPNEDARALAKAAGKGKIKKIEELVKSGVDVDAKGTQGATPLFWAMANYKGFKKLLELGADPNIVYGDGNTVIHTAVRIKDSRFLEALLEHGANPNLKVESRGKWQTLESTPLFDALSQGKARIDLLLSSGADLNARDSFGDTAVMTAAGMGEFEVVHYLLEQGADYQIKNTAGETLANRVANTIGAMRPGSDAVKWQAKVIDWLESRGVQVR
jgi:ankyrin repeat protein